MRLSPNQGAWLSGGLRYQSGLMREPRVKAEAGRQHQPLLRAPDRDIDAPFVMPVVDRAERGNRIDHEQRRVPRLIDRGTDLGDAARHAGRGLVMHDADRFDAVLAIGGELFGDLRRIDAWPPIAGHEFDIEAEPS